MLSIAVTAQVLNQAVPPVPAIGWRAVRLAAGAGVRSPSSFRGLLRPRLRAARSPGLVGSAISARSRTFLQINETSRSGRRSEATVAQSIDTTKGQGFGPVATP
jgi:hypothetical protein